ncbi:MAG: 4-alpha-glucanotransferase [Thermoleophilia bacterium]
MTPVAAPIDPTDLRRAGVLLHLSSLPEGRLGDGARRMIDWLAEAGQGWWQVLPLSPPDAYGSPYAGLSAFAAWPGYLERPHAPVTDAEVIDFRDRNAYWIDDWAGGDREALHAQVRLDREWAALRRRAADHGVRILGDLPFYVAESAADVRAHPDLFRRDLVAGVPPDAFTADGQLWGNPTYDWEAMRADGWRWWVERLRRSAALYDASRIDHFRAFEAWWGVPRDAETAREGAWLPGPGEDVIGAARAALGPISLVAEDLGIITDEVRDLMGRLGLPGMRVLQFAFPGGGDNTHRPEHHPERAVVYTGTHDNDTTLGWWAAAGDEARRQATECAAAHGIHDDRPERLMMRLALASRAGLAIVPAQDVLGLGSAARLNTPGTTGGNWRWRLTEGQLGRAEASWLRDATEAAGRLP